MLESKDKSHFVGKKIFLWGIVLVAIYSCVWMAMSFAGKKILEHWGTVVGNGRLELQYSALDVSGFPFLIRLSVTDAEVMLPASTGIGKASLKIPKLVATINPLLPIKILIQSDGAANYQLDYEDFSSDFNTARYEGAIASLKAVAGLSLSSNLGIDALSVDLEGFHLSSSMPAPYQKIQRVQLSVDLAGGLPNALDFAQLQRWSNDGGSIEHFSLSADYGELTITSFGHLGLDEALRLKADSEVKLTGFMSFAEALGESGLYSELDVHLLKGTMDLLADKEENKPSTIQVSMSSERGGVYLGHLPVMRLPKNLWL